jgi:hypothetical protein
MTAIPTVLKTGTFIKFIKNPDLARGKPFIELYFLDGGCSAEDRRMIDSILHAFRVDFNELAASNYVQDPPLRNTKDGKTRYIYTLDHVIIDPSLRSAPEGAGGPDMLTSLVQANRPQSRHTATSSEIEIIGNCIEVLLRPPIIRECTVGRNSEDQTLRFDYYIFDSHTPAITQTILQRITGQAHRQIIDLLAQNGMEGTVTGPQLPKKFDMNGRGVVSYTVSSIRGTSRDIDRHQLELVAQRIVDANLERSRL